MNCHMACMTLFFMSHENQDKRGPIRFICGKLECFSCNRIIGVNINFHTNNDLFTLLLFMENSTFWQG